MSTAFPRVSYVGRSAQKEVLQHWSGTLDPQAGCRVLYFQAGGGLGKTWLLNSYPAIIEPTGLRLAIADIIDFYNFENRNPNVIERKLIDSLKHAAGQPADWCHLPADQVDAIFQPYNHFYGEYMRAREQESVSLARETSQKLRALFVECWNRLAAEVPLVMRFDTVETLYQPAAPPEALVNAAGAMTGSSLVLDWIKTVLPRLRASLALFSGRPLRDRSDNPFIDALRQTDLLIEPVQELHPFDNRREVREYLQRYASVELDDEQIHYSLAITHGHPLLLTCYAQTLRSELSFPPGLPLHELPPGRPAFESWLIKTILNPLQPAGISQQTLLFCLHLLSYARRGIRRSELQALFDSEQMGLDEYDPQVIAGLDQVALVKVVQDREFNATADDSAMPNNNDELLFLHDEIHVLIDESGLQSELGLREVTLTYLAELNKQQVRRINQGVRRVAGLAHLLKAMADQLYYELSYDLVRGYRTYAVYTNWLLAEIDIEETLLLSDVFWSTLGYRVQRAEQVVQPYSDVLARSNRLSYAEILADEQVNQISLLIAQGYNQDASSYAEQLYAEFRQRRLIPADEQDLRDAAAFPGDPPFARRSLYVNFTLRRAFALVLGHGITARAETLFSTVISVLEWPDFGQADQREAFLLLRKDYFLGFAYLIRGYMRRQQQRFSEAQVDYEQGRAAFKRYRQNQVELDGRQIVPEVELNDYVLPDLAQITNNLAYNLARAGNLKRALRLSNEVIQEFTPFLGSYRRALFFNTNALIHLLAGDIDNALPAVEKAEQAARDTGSRRALGLVAQARAFYERNRMKFRREPRVDIETHYEQAADYLHEEPQALYETYLDWARFERDLSKLYAHDNDAETSQVHQRYALQRLDDAYTIVSGELSMHMQQIDVLEHKISMYINMHQYAEAEALLSQAEAMMARSQIKMPAYSHILSGKLALQQSYLALEYHSDPQAALSFMAVALARVYCFARYHRDQQTFEALIVEQIEQIEQIDAASLKDFRQLTEREDLYVASDDLPYQRPNATVWSTAWEESIEYINAAITERIG
jgi:hypothetical protein